MSMNNFVAVGNGKSILLATTCYDASLATHTHKHMGRKHREHPTVYNNAHSAHSNREHSIFSNSIRAAWRVDTLYAAGKRYKMRKSCLPTFSPADRREQPLDIKLQRMRVQFRYRISYTIHKRAAIMTCGTVPVLCGPLFSFHAHMIDTHQTHAA